jgi:spermidine dehydrogenase
MNNRDRELGMGRPITRRDFFDGVALTVGGLLASSSTEGAVRAGADGSPLKTSAIDSGYPPGLTGIRGQNQSAVDVAHSMRDGKVFDTGEDTGEIYDLVVVGAGLSGLAAAYYFRKALPDTKVLLLEGCDDFGGHARRDEMTISGHQVIGAGGTVSISRLQTYTLDGKRLLADIGIDADRLTAADGAQTFQYRDMGLRRAAFFDKETYGVDRLVAGFPGEYPVGGFASAAPGLPWAQFLAKTPLSQSVRDGLLRIATESKDYMPGLTAEEKTQRLRKMSYQDYLLKWVKVDPGVVQFLFHFDDHAFNGAAGLDSYSAWAAFRCSKDGFAGMGLQKPAGSWTTAPAVSGHLPDGNAGVARLLVRWLIPGSLPGSSMEDSVVPHLDYGMLDRTSNAVRIRLSSMVVRVKHNGDPGHAKEVEVTYVRNGRAFRAKGGAVVMACFNAVVPHVCPELPQSQKDALHMSVRMPIVYTNVMLRNWKAFEKLGVSNIYSPNAFHAHCGLDRAVSLGEYRRSPRPEDPTYVNMWKIPTEPNTGLSARDQFRVGRAKLLAISFQEFERNVRDQLGRALSAGGFDPARDIAGIFVNRWGHGYAGCANDLYDPDWARDEVPWLVGRKRFGLIAIANSDAGAACLTQCAFDQAHRAVSEIIGDVIRPQFEYRWGERT